LFANPDNYTPIFIKIHLSQFQRSYSEQIDYKVLIVLYATKQKFTFFRQIEILFHKISDAKDKFFPDL